jgi:hypothetical protein
VATAANNREQWSQRQRGRTNIRAAVEQAEAQALLQAQRSQAVTGLTPLLWLCAFTAATLFGIEAVTGHIFTVAESMGYGFGCAVVAYLVTRIFGGGASR